MTTSRRSGYSLAQILLHWLIAALVLFQLVFGESMVAATDAAESGQPLPAFDAAFATGHFWVGIGILLLAVLRLGIRLSSPAPAPSEASALLDLAARASHWAFYVLLVLVPVTGLWTVYVDPEMGELHRLAKPVFIALIAVHAGAALFHHVVLRDGTLDRMLRPADKRKKEIR